MKENETVLILGGAGFIGSELASRLFSSGYDVVVIDSFHPFCDPREINYSKVYAYRKELLKKATFIQDDVSVTSSLIKYLIRFKPSIIIHLAAVTRADINDDYFNRAVKTTINPILSAAETNSFHDIKRFIYFSSSYVYGDFNYSPCDEIHPLNPKSTYGSIKLAGEILTRNLFNSFSIPYSIIRPIAVFGPGDVNGKLSMQNLKTAILKGKFSVYGYGSEVLDYTFIDDLCNGVLLAMSSEDAVNEVFNISNGFGYSYEDIVEALKNIGIDSMVEYLPVKINRPKRGVLSTEKANKILGYHPKTSLEEGLRKCVEFLTDFQF